jgi:diaminopimelate decarboxylase
MGFLMGAFQYAEGILACDGVPLEAVAASVGTPFYVYSRSKVESNLAEVQNALSGRNHLICYSLKANSNPSLLRLLAAKGCGADVVSGGELETALKAGIPPERIVFAGVGKTDAEIEAAVRIGVLSINVESVDELRIVDSIARKTGISARVAIRVNPIVDAKTHPYIATGLRESKFGIPIHQALDAFKLARSLKGLETVGVHCHIGSMILETAPYIEAVRSLSDLIARLARIGVALKHADVGGGLGLDYTHVVDEPGQVKKGLPPGHLFESLLPLLSAWRLRVIFEPGRFIVADSGALVTRVVLTKETGPRKFIVVDAGMNDLIRPCLYSAYHQIVEVRRRVGQMEKVSVVGPICESGDFFAHDRMLPRLERGDLLAVMAAGAYGFSLSSNYNSRLRAPEVLIENGSFRIIREREKTETLWRGTELDKTLAGKVKTPTIKSNIKN